MTHFTFHHEDGAEYLKLEAEVFPDGTILPINPKDGTDPPKLEPGGYMMLWDIPGQTAPVRISAEEMMAEGEDLPDDDPVLENLDLRDAIDNQGGDRKPQTFSIPGGGDQVFLPCDGCKRDLPAFVREGPLPETISNKEGRKFSALRVIVVDCVTCQKTTVHDVEPLWDDEVETR